ncbi:MAG: outer membrane beta-barrel protein [Flavobacterium sp.]
MKKLIAIGFILFISSMNAQVTFRPGLRAGAAFSTFSNTRSDYKADFYIGGFGEIALTKIYTLQPEITYTRQGSNNVKTYVGYNENNGEDIIEYRDLEINYVSIAMVNKFTFKGGFQVQVGPTIDFRTSDNLIHEKSDADLAFVAGFGYKVPSTGLTIEARVKKGLVDVIDSDYYGSNGNTDYWFGDYNTNVSFQLGVSYAFGK